MTCRMTAGFVLVSLLVVSTLMAGPIWMRRSEVLIPVNGEECLARAFRALRTEGFTPTQNLSNGVWGSKGSRWTLILCNAAPSGQMWVNLVSSSLEAEADAHYPDHEHVAARMSEPSTASTPVSGGGGVPPGRQGRFLSVSVNGRHAIVDWSNAPTTSGSWVSIVTVGTADSTHIGRWVYTEQKGSGRYENGPLDPGSYEARFYADAAYGNLVDRVRFEIGHDKGASPAAQGRILSVQVDGRRFGIVTWSNAPTDNGSWVSIVPAGTPDTAHVGRWAYTGQTASGKYESGPLSAGEYEARFYSDSGYGRLVERVRFRLE